MTVSVPAEPAPHRAQALDAGERRWRAAEAFGASVAAWSVLLAVQGSVLDLSAADYVRRIVALPGVYHSPVPAEDYRNWSILPLVLGRLFGVESARAFAAFNLVVLAVGTSALVAWVAQRSGPHRAYWVLAGVMASCASSYSLYFAGSYDQLTVPLLLAATLVRHRYGAVAVGLALGLTHSELGLLVALGLVVVAVVDDRERIVTRACTTAGIVVGRVALTIWLDWQGGSSDRFDYVGEHGIGRTAGYLADTWPVVVWTALLGGWLLAAALFAIPAARVRLLLAAAWLIGALAVITVTVDQTRVAAYLCLPLIVLMCGWLAEHRANHAIAVGAALVGILAPLTVSLAGNNYIFSNPFQVRW